MQRWHKVLLAASLFLSFFSFFIFYQELHTNPICGTSCESVQSSKYGSIAGIDLSLLGGIAFLLQAIVLILAAETNSRWLWFAVMASYIIAPLSSIQLIAIQEFILHQFCPMCLVVDIGSIASGVLFWLTRW